MPAALYWATSLKWVLLGLAIVTIAVRAIAPYSAPRPDDPRPTLVRTGRALMQHRFSVAFVVPLLVLTVLSGSAVLEQLPDVQRRWVTDGPAGQRQAQMAVIALLVSAFLLAMLGRQRTGWARRHPKTPGPPPEEPGRPLLSIWIVGPAIAVVGGAVAAVSMEAPVLWVGSRSSARCPSRSPVHPCCCAARGTRILSDGFPTGRPSSASWRSRPSAFTGHALALAALTIGGLGLVRSFTSMVILRPELVATGSGLIPAQADLSARFFALGVAGVVLPWLISLVAAILARSGPTQLPATTGLAAPTRLWPRWLVLAAVLLTVFGVASHPGAVAELGVSAVAILSLGALIGIPAAAGLLIQDRPTAEVFRFLGLRRTPLVSMLLIAVVLVGALSGQTTIHRVVDPTTIEAAATPESRTPESRIPEAEDPQRRSVDTLVDDWLATDDGCVFTIGGREVRPMIMIAAEGGGIRAAYWTVKGLQAIEDGTSGLDGCGAHSTLFSTGASGGSVGLTVARFSGTRKAPGTTAAVAAVAQMARPDPLAQGVVGTFVRDPLYGAMGVPIGTDGVAPPGSWADRARLLEMGWSGGDAAKSWGTRDFLSADTDLSPTSGPLILNSTSVAGRCRVWVSQVDLAQPLTAGEQECDQQDGTGPRTIDLVSAYTTIGRPSAGEDTETAGCLHGLQAATAAMLTARFPYVTPGGVVGPCSPDGADGGSWTRTQLIDGGYTENTGLATITDLSVSWLAQVRRHNETAMAPGSDAPLIIPFVVFLTNEEGQASALREPARLQSELLLPPIEYLRGQGTLNTTDALLQRAGNAVRSPRSAPRSPTRASTAPRSPAVSRTAWWSSTGRPSPR